MKLRDKVAVITGSGQGIGQEMARVFADEGARVIVADVDGDAAQHTVQAIVDGGGAAHAVCVDITHSDQVEAMVQAAVDHFGRLDVLVNNAGIGLNCSFLETTLADWERVLQVNLTGSFLCAQAAARVMVEQGGGRIVNVGSISGQRGAQGRAAYGASKAGVMQLTRIMAVELASKGIRVNAVSPGPVDTEQSRSTHTEGTRRSYLSRIPLNRYGERREIASAVVFLASDDSSFVTGHVLNVDGGFKMAGLMFED